MGSWPIWADLLVGIVIAGAGLWAWAWLTR